MSERSVVQKINPSSVTHETQDRITIKGLKVAEFASEETLCMTCSVHFDGKKVGTASNSGHGGATSIHVDLKARDLFAQAVSFAKSLPADVVLLGGDEPQTAPLTIEVDLEYVVDYLAGKAHTANAIKRSFDKACKSRVVYLYGPGDVRQSKKLPAAQLTTETFRRAQERTPEAKVLNLLPYAAALALFAEAHA